MDYEELLQQILTEWGVADNRDVVRHEVFQAVLCGLAEESCVRAKRFVRQHIDTYNQQVEVFNRNHEEDDQADPITDVWLATLLDVAHMQPGRWLRPDNRGVSLFVFARLLSLLGLRFEEIPPMTWRDAWRGGRLPALRDVLSRFEPGRAPALTPEAEEALFHGAFEAVHPGHLAAHVVVGLTLFMADLPLPLPGMEGREPLLGLAAVDHDETSIFDFLEDNTPGTQE